MSKNEELVKMSKMLMIAGQQQNVGKTTLACRIISHFSRENKIIALKVSPHFHADTGSSLVIEEGENWQILEEKSMETKKDTSRMLAAGAEQAFLIQAEMDSLLVGFNKFLSLVPANSLIVCESAGLRDYVIPGVFLMIRQLYCKVCSIDDNQMLNLADRIVTFAVNGFDITMGELNAGNEGWQLNNN
ncbi:MAG: hypothetical protein JXA77_01805 [Bacteroidales bacterium]|nr:hypothetical protein [Bacteroidales bacterium]MBN2818907.1 hypothetical protein [Bacteroidales bacterium]